MSLLKFLNFPPVPSPVRPDARRDRNTEDGCWHRPEEMAGDPVGATSQEQRTR
ncbi:unnamed protein product [Staurois parvus]|uniref:Uncharacterized protein n=1 Tax=Staurois parvus TaxID=386267 RepID=A0ABN9C1P8_9NEOB|nr:unnamed protein product [Staurois parvus]